MIRSTPLWRSVAVVSVAGLVLTGCGGGDEDGGAAPAPSAPASEASTPAATASGPANASDGTLTLGTLLPQTGTLASLGPPEFAGVDLAIQDINAAGGVLGQDVAKVDSDSGDTTNNIAPQSVSTLLARNVDAIIGAASSSVSLSVIDAISGAGVVQVSPANTSPEFTDYADEGFYFRTAPSDVLQGRVLGDVMLNDGASAVGMLTIQDSYGTGLAGSLRTSVEEGGGEVVSEVVFNPEQPNYSSEVSEVLAAGPDAIALISFDQAVRIVPELAEQGFDMSKVYFVDGNISDYSEEFAAGTLENAKGTLPGAQSPEAFRQRLLEIDPELQDFSYSGESYDASVLVALAAEAAQDDSGQGIASQMVAVSREGEKCTTFEQCKTLLGEGTDIDYDGISGPVEFSDAGDPTQATIGVYQYAADNTYTFLEGQAGSLS